MRGYACIGLDNPKNPHNVGAVLRAAGCYRAGMVATSGSRYNVAVDLIEGAIPLHEYKHPERAFYIFGQEDGTLGERVLSYCRDVVYIPTSYCMNLAATVNVVLYDRMSKILKENQDVRTN